MYSCERCGTRFGRPSAVLESCPRCLTRDGVRVALAFRLFEEARSAPRAGSRSGGLEEAVRERLASTDAAVPRIGPERAAELRSQARDAA
jgi:hypothetical protein